jgi:hypothetical protein
LGNSGVIAHLRHGVKWSGVKEVGISSASLSSIALTPQLRVGGGVGRVAQCDIARNSDDDAACQVGDDMIFFGWRRIAKVGREKSLHIASCSSCLWVG